MKNTGRSPRSATSKVIERLLYGKETRAFFDRHVAAPARSRWWFFDPVAWGALLLIELYRRRPGRSGTPRCRFTPSCSTYMSVSIRKYGTWRGVPYGLNRIRRCVGFAPHGEQWP